MTRRSLLLTVVVGGLILLGYDCQSLVVIFDDSTSNLAIAGGVIWLVASAGLITVSLTNRKFWLFFLAGLALTTSMMMFYVQQQRQYGYVTYAGRGGGQKQVDWRAHPQTAFYTVVWAIALPALISFYVSRRKRP
ncbi:MAG TPA: hypothetical protein VLI05_04970 [Candidatus Saccharimonadia bacterium]|nr:hypothetical protein [Candidatus Saccharimonadia bacterium]